MAIGPTTGKTASNASASTTLAFTATAITAGQDIVVGVALADTAQTVTGIADTAGNVFTLRSAVNGSGVRTEVWEAQEDLAHATDIITITFSGATLAAAAFEEYSGTILQVTPVIPTTNAVPVMTGYTTPSGTVSASESCGSTPAWHAFVGGGDAGWITNAGALPQWLQYQFPTAQVVRFYAIAPWSADTFPSRSPTAWILKGSNDGSSWTDLDTRSYASGSWVLNTLAYFPVTSPGSYTHYRLHITANGGNPYTGLKQLALSLDTYSYIILSVQNTATRTGSNAWPGLNLAYQERVNWSVAALGFVCASGDTLTAGDGTVRQSIVPALTSVGVALVDNIGGPAVASLPMSVRLSTPRAWAAAGVELRSGGTVVGSYLDYAGHLPITGNPIDRETRIIHCLMPALTFAPTLGSGPSAHGWAY